MTDALATTEEKAIQDWAALEPIIKSGDLSQLEWPQRWQYYKMVCHSLGLNPVTSPFTFLENRGKVSLYVNKEGVAQLAERKHVSIISIDDDLLDKGVYRVKVTAQVPSGRTSMNVGIVVVANLSGEALANAMMKAVTKGVRRTIITICGVGFLDETEVETIPGARTINAESPEDLSVPPGFSADLRDLDQAPSYDYESATDNQAATIAKLSRMLGREAPTGDFLKGEASDLITELSHEYNEKKGKPRSTGEQPRPMEAEAQPNPEPKETRSEPEKAKNGGAAPAKQRTELQTALSERAKTTGQKTGLVFFEALEAQGLDRSTTLNSLDAAQLTAMIDWLQRQDQSNTEEPSLDFELDI